MNKSFFIKVFSALLIVMLALGALPITPAYAADTGLLSPTASVAGATWTNPNNAFSSNNLYATSGNGGQTVNYTTFGITIPAGQQIDGIEVLVEGTTTGRDITVELSWNNGANYTAPINLNFGNGADQTLTAGGAANTWGRAWNPATDFTNANFRVRITSTGGGNTFSMDHVQVRVTYTPDVAPTFTSIALQTPATSPTNANTLVFRATFSEGVQNVSTGDFAVTGTTATVTNVAVVSASVYDVTVTGGNLAALNGTVGLNLAAGQNIQDTTGNALPNTEPATDQTYVVDNTAPSVVSLAIQNPATSPTNANSLVFRITFNEDVTNIDVNDFDVAGTTANVTAVTTVTANTVFDLTVSGGDLAGLNNTVTINLDVTGGGQQDITDTAGNAMPNPAPNPTASYVVDNTAPTTATITQAAGQTDPTSTLPINFQVTFPQAINLSSFVPADITNGGTAAGVKTVTITEIAPNNGTTFNVAINGLTGSGTVTISIAAGTWQDAAGNNNTAASTNTDNSVQYNANTAPTVQAVITDVNVLEDAANTVFSLYPNFQDAESADNLLTYTVTGNTNPGLFTSVNIVDPTNFTLDYAPDANGVANITIRATDPSGLFVEDIFQVTVNAVNDEPSFTASNPAAVNEDAGAQSVAGWATVASFGAANESGQAVLAYNISGSTCGTLLSAGPAVSVAGTLTYTPAANANGTCTFNVAMQDNGGVANGGDDTSPTQNFTITVNAINDEPSFGISSLIPTVNEDAGAVSVPGWIAFFNRGGGPDEVGQTVLNWIVSNNTCGGLLSAGPSVVGNTLSYTTAANANGTCTFDLQVQDNGGTANGGDDTSPAINYTITVNAVNDEPSFTASNPAAVNEDAGVQTVNAWASFNPGNASEAGQTATYSVSNLGASCATLLSAGPAVNPAGDLSYTPATNQNGTCTFDVSVQDNGGTANGGDDTSSTQSFSITVNVVNDAPSVTVAPDQFHTDATTVIPQGGSTNETSVVFKATATDAESDQYTLEVEVVDNVAAFTDTATCTSPLTNSGTEASTGSCGPFVSGSYKWQYRFVDSNLFASAWTAFAGSDPDFIIDNGSPLVTNVTSSTANGTYFPGDTISIQVTFNEIVNVTGTPQLLLELGAVDGLANYVSGNGSDTLTFTYTVQPGDNTLDLDYVANTSLTLNGGSIQDTALNNASLTLPNPGAAGSLGANKDIVIDALILVVVNNGVGSIPDTGDGSLSENEQVANTLNINQLVVRFNKDVNDVPASTTDPDEVDNPANYVLVRSATGVFNTLSCAGGVVAPDIINPVTSVTYSNGGGSGPFVATVTLSAPLTTDGYYRLFVCGTTSIVQANNTALALAGNGIANGTDFIRNFQLVTPAAGGGGGGGGGAANDTKLAVAALPATGFAPGRITKLPVQPDELAYSDLGEMWIEIPSLGIKTSIVGVPQTAEGEWDVTWLANNVGWLNGTAFPTWEGNSVVTAHVTNADGLDGPFSNLKKLKYGDQIIIHLYGQKYTFEVRNSRLTRPFTTSFAFEDLEDASYLTLITCQTYLPKSDTYMHRRVIRAVLVSVQDE